MSNWTALVLFWFGASVLTFSASQLWLVLRLHSAGVKYPFGLSGTPGYTDRIYIKHCQESGRPFRTFLFIRRALFVSVVLSCFFAIPIMGGAQPA